MTTSAALLIIVAATTQQTAAVRQPASPPPRPEIHVQTGHVRIFNTLDVSADGRLAATSADGFTGDGSVKIWDLTTGRQIRTISLRGGDISNAVLSPDHRLVAAKQRNDRVTVFDVTTGRLVSTFESGWREPFTFTADGRALIVGLTLWNPLTGRVLFDVRPESATKPPFEAWKAEITADGRLLAASSEKGETRLLRLDTGRRVRVPAGASAPFAFSSSGSLMAGRTAGGAVGIWQIATGRQVMTSAPTPVAPALFTAGDRELIVIDQPRREPATVAVLNAADGRELRRLEIGEQYDCANCSVSVSPNGKWVIQGGWRSQRLSIWNLHDPREQPRAWQDLDLPQFTVGGNGVAAAFDGNRIWSIDLNTGVESCAAPAFGVALLSAVWSTSPGWLATGDIGGGVVAWDAKTGIPSPIPAAQVAQTPSLSFLASGAPPHMTIEGISGWPGPLNPRVRWMTPACPAAPEPRDNASRRPGPWDSASLDSVRAGSGYAVAFSPGGGWVLSNIEEHPWIHVANALNAKRIATLDAHPGEDRGVVTALAARRTGSEFASSTTVDAVISIWNPASWRRERFLRGHDERVTALAYDEITGQLASAGWDNTVRLWNTASEREISRWRLDGVASAIAFSPDGQRLVAVIDNQILELRRGSALRRVFAQTAQAAAVSYSPDGRLLVAANVDGSTNLWDAKSGRLLATLISFARGEEWLVVTPEGYFDGSPAAWRQILWRFNRNAYDVVPVETYYREFYRQGLLAEVFAGTPPPARVRLDAIDRRQPQITVSAEKTASGRRVPVHVEVHEAPADRNHQRGSGVRDVRLFRNGSLIHVWHGDIKLDAGRATLRLEDAAIVAGENRFTAYAFSRTDIKSQDHEVVVTGASRPRPGIAWILSIGINNYVNRQLKLDLAVGDAEAFATQFSEAQKRLGRYEPRVVSLLDRAATRANMLLALDILAGKREAPEDAPENLRALKRAEPEDAVVIFFAGHGTADRGRFYLIPRDVGFLGTRDDLSADEFRQMVSGSISDQDLSRSLEGIDAHDIVLLIDACRSGQALHADDPRQGPMNSPGLAQLAYEKGMYILTAAQAYQDAIEAPETKDRRAHGLLTQALLDNLAADGGAGKGLRQWLDAAAAGVPALYRAARQTRQLPIVEEQVQRPRVFYRRFPERTPFIVVAGSGS